VELAPEDAARRFVPEDARRPYRCRFQCPQDGELTPEVVRLQETRHRRAEPQHELLPVIAVGVAPLEGQDHRLGRVPERDAIEARDVHSVGAPRELRREPARQAGAPFVRRPVQLRLRC
jgi:hypothetical protein